MPEFLSDCMALVNLNSNQSLLQLALANPGNSRIEVLFHLAGSMYHYSQPVKHPVDDGAFYAKFWFSEGTLPALLMKTVFYIERFEMV